MLNLNCLRDYDFLNKFCPLFEGMINLGLSKKQALKALGAQDFVQDFVDTPEWLISVKKLPKGYKWSNGTRFHFKGDKRDVSETYILLTIDDDIYIKNFFGTWCYFLEAKDGEKILNNKGEEVDSVIMNLPKEEKNQIVVIKDFKNIEYSKIYTCLKEFASVGLLDAILTIYKENGVYTGLIERELKEVF